jgi:hypothetical protein
MDMSAYADGTISFDIFVESVGNQDLYVALACWDENGDYTCHSPHVRLDISKQGWHTVTLPLSDFTGPSFSGYAPLDFSQISAGLIFSNWGWSEQDRPQMTDKGDLIVRFANVSWNAGPSIFTHPELAESWGGFANTDPTIYPIMLSSDATISFLGSVPSGEAVDVRFRFEFDAYPETEPSYETSSVTVSGTDEKVYTIEVPSQGTNTFSSFLMYLDTKDVGVSITNVGIAVAETPAGTGSDEDSDPVEEPTAGVLVSDSDDFVATTDDTWVQEATLALAAEGESSRDTQTFSINVTALPSAGANYRVYETIANGDEVLGASQALSYGVNDVTVAAVAFDRKVSVQLSSGDVEFDALSINNRATVSDYGTFVHLKDRILDWSAIHHSGLTLEAFTQLKSAVDLIGSDLTEDGVVAFDNGDQSNPVSFALSRTGNGWSLYDFFSTVTGDQGQQVTISGDAASTLGGLGSTSPVVTSGGGLIFFNPVTIVVIP